MKHLKGAAMPHRGQPDPERVRAARIERIAGLVAAKMSAYIDRERRREEKRRKQSEQAERAGGEMIERARRR
ncbi:MAG: hypothetical protein GEV05_28295 [Betaproteobacteria bacterium]|nr:hypothetical protein [Betaproteobacteria bacterium]